LGALEPDADFMEEEAEARAAFWAAALAFCLAFTMVAEQK
jgi:hypothetical protein